MTRRPVTPPEPQRANLTVDQMRSGIDRLKRRIADLDQFDPQTVQKRWGPEVATLETAIKETLAAVFGHNTVQYKDYEPAARLDRGPVNASADASWISARNGNIGGRPRDDMQEVYRYLAEGKQRAILLLRQAIRGLEEEIADREQRPVAAITHEAAPQRDLTKVFVVHGHDGEVRQTVARFIEQLGFEAVILHERPNKGRTIITKFREEAAGVGFAVVLMTPDDVGGVPPFLAAKMRPRARQNVVFELGFFIGVLGPGHVAALVKGNIERPSDFDGVVYIDLDEGGAWKMMLARELRAAGLSFDANKVFG